MKFESDLKLWLVFEVEGSRYTIDSSRLYEGHPGLEQRVAKIISILKKTPLTVTLFANSKGEKGVEIRMCVFFDQIFYSQNSYKIEDCCSISLIPAQTDPVPKVEYTPWILEDLNRSYGRFSLSESEMNTVYNDGRNIVIVYFRPIKGVVFCPPIKPVATGFGSPR